MRLGKGGSGWEGGQRRGSEGGESEPQASYDNHVTTYDVNGSLSEYLCNTQ